MPEKRPQNEIQISENLASLWVGGSKDSPSLRDWIRFVEAERFVAGLLRLSLIRLRDAVSSQAGLLRR